MEAIKRRVNISMDEETLNRLDSTAGSLGLSRSAYLSFLVNSVDFVVTSSNVTPADVANTLKGVVDAER